LDPLAELAAPPPLVALPEPEPPAPPVGAAADLDPLASELAEELEADPPEGAAEDPAEDVPAESPEAPAPLSFEPPSFEAPSLFPALSAPPFSEPEAGFLAPLSRKSVTYQPVPLS